MPKMLVAVFLILAFGAGQVLDGLVRYSIKTEYYIWQVQDVPWLHFAVGIANFCLLSSAIYALFNRKSIGISLCIVSSIWMSVYSAILTNFAVQNLNAVRELYMLGREVRGLSVRPEAADLIFSESGMWASWSISAIMALVVIAIVLWHRKWFSVTEGSI